jgi:hypothetical protein
MKTKRTIFFSLMTLAFGGFSAHVASADDAKPAYTLQKTIPIPGDERWDYALFNPDTHHLFVTRATHTQEIDPAAGTVVHDITGQKRSHGTAIVADLNRGFITDGQDATIIIFDLKTGDVLGKVPAADDVDGIIYDTGSKQILAACGDSAKLAVVAPDVDPKTGKATLIDLPGKPEYLAADGAGKAYVNINDKNEIAVVDLNSKTVTANWPTGTGGKNTGMAIDPEHHLLFVGCRTPQKLVIMSTDDGKVVAELPIGKGNDACAFDPGTGEAFASCGDGTLAVAKETSPGKWEATTVQTKTGARTVALDKETHTLYLPTAEFEPAQGGGRPAMKKGSFMIVVVGPASGK